MSETTQGIDIQAGIDIGAIFRAIGRAFKKLFTTDEAKQQEQAILNFVKTDVGKIAVSAVEYANALLPGSGQGEAKRVAALAKLQEDLTAAGKDISGIAKSTLNWFIETALQYVLGKALTLAASDGEEKLA